MTGPSGLVLHCEECGDVPHRVLRGRVGGRDEIVFEGVVKCTSCGRVRSVVTRESRPKEVPIVVSWLGRSVRTRVELGPGEKVRVGDEIEAPDGRVRITAIEVGTRRVKAAEAGEVRTLWGTRADKVRVPVSVNFRNRTKSLFVVAAPDEEFTVGDILDVSAAKVVVQHIRTGSRTVHEGSATAAEIVRVYGRAVRERTSR